MDSNNQFIQDVKMLQEPAVVVCYDQLDDLVQFCTNNDEFGILTIDPTFSLSDFDVTVITYRHLLLHSKRTGIRRTGSRPLSQNLRYLPPLFEHTRE